MAKCTNCGKKIGYFQTEYNYTDDNGKVLIVCFECLQNFKIAEERNRKNEEKEKRLSLIRPTIDKYFTKCDTIKKVAINSIYADEKSYGVLIADGLEGVRSYLENINSNIDMYIKSGRIDSLDSFLTLKQSNKIGLDSLSDIEKIYKILTKKRINTNHEEILAVFHTLFDDLGTQDYEKIVRAEHKRISNKLMARINVKDVLKEFISSPLEFEVDEKLSKSLLKKFNLDFDEGKLSSLMEEIKKEIELEDFEENMGEKTTLQKLPDYDSLNGHQFEAFLKKVF